MTITITPIHDCKACHGGGWLQRDGGDYCGCVLDQLLDDDADYDIELKPGIETMEVEYALDCSCGQPLRLELTSHEQQAGRLRRTARIIAELFTYFHAQHGTVKGGFALKAAA
jgi:hypothetical protein